MNEEQIKIMIQRHEGYRPYIYYDTLGYPTGGYGHAFLPNSPLSHDVAVLLFNDDFNQAVRDYNKLGFSLDPVRRAVIIDMLFNLGLTRFRGFVKMIQAIKAANHEKASEELLDSKYARQVKGRAYRLARMLQTGEA